ncbi:hypothetical protein HQN86_25520 [Pedobacter panaciterrae]|jgi:hypothetical protein|uniref:hypothetical protein n=1 Tax=Pedobacter panaciterrae TaxID=363849 RepID=UPI00155DC69A|nr:hypothetical protein [Pedobacter panaciterrae]NQX57004.1 hypothetical protein [Pedobacter panaciterrae]
MENKHESSEIPCCPELLKDSNCDVLVFTRTLNYPLSIKGQERQTALVAQLLISFKLSRCTIGNVLGDPVYTTTLLPGEKVRLVTTDRRSKFTYDASTQLSYRSEQISEEQYFMKASQSYFSDMENNQSGNQNSENKDHWDFSGGSSSSIDINPFSPGVDSNSNSTKNHNSSSTLDYLNSQSSNMRASATQAVNATQKAHSISIGEVATKVHAEGQSEDHFESSSREFSNPNGCHAISYFFYRMNKKQVVKFELVSIEKLISVSGITNFAFVNPTITPAMREEALKELNKELIATGILDDKGEVSAAYRKKFEFSMEFSLPTAGVIVKGCLDECNTCEPAARERIHLQNELLRRQIELLEKSQEYRCCPNDCDTEKDI